MISKFNKFVKHIFELRDSPHSIALGVAIGIFVGLTPTIGMQMIISAIVATFCGANRIAAISMVYITNPLTVIPVYTSIYYFGSFMLGVEHQGFSRVLKKILSQEDTWAKFRMIISQGWVVQGPLWFGAVIVGVFCAVPSYFLVKRMVVRHRERIGRKRVRHEPEGVL